MAFNGPEPGTVNKQMDSPAGYNGKSGPGNALKMPTKHYASSTDMATKGKSNTMDSPAKDKGTGA